MHAYFGTRWDAPAFEDAVQVETPVGAVCELGCGELVDEGDDGLMMPYMSAEAMKAGGAPGMMPMHLECYLRSILGCRAHLEHRCSCYGGDAHDGHSRAAAKEVLAWLRTNRP